MEWSFLTSDHCMKLQGDNLKICKTAWRSLKMLLALHSAFRHEANQESSHFFAFSGNIINFVKVGYYTTPPPQTYHSHQPWFLPAKLKHTHWMVRGIKTWRRLFPRCVTCHYREELQNFPLGMIQGSAVKLLFTSSISRDRRKLQKSKHAVHEIWSWKSWAN